LWGFFQLPEPTKKKKEKMADALSKRSVEADSTALKKLMAKIKNE
jgi:hypothetical protein